MQLNRPLYLTGFMGVGKTTIGRLLAEQLDCGFIDLDEQIAARTGLSIPEIFAAQGEPYFRRLETEALKSLPRDAALVCATGGGLVMSADNRAFMRSTGVVVYLRAEWTTLQARLAGSHGRPLLPADDDWSQVEQLLARRTVHYEEADLIVDTDGRSAREVVSCIVNHISGLKA